MYECMYVMYVCMYVRTDVRMYVCIYIYVCVCVCICICIFNQSSMLYNHFTMSRPSFQRLEDQRTQHGGQRPQTMSGGLHPTKKMMLHTTFLRGGA